MQPADPKRCIVVGDIHGELKGLREILTDAKLVDDSEDNWVGGTDTLIQVGDVIDRGPHSRGAIELLKKIQKEAASAGGEVVRLCGNHELMLLQNCFKYVDFKNPESLADELKTEILRGDVRASHTDGTRLYTHAGLKSIIRKSITSEMKPANSNATKNDLFWLSDHINRVFKASVENNDLSGHPIFHRSRDRGGSDPVGGIFWCDFSSMRPPSEAKILQIFGHTPTSKKGVRTEHGLKLINVDAGMSQVYGDNRAYLEITAEGHLVQHSKSRNKWRTTMLGKN